MMKKLFLTAIIFPTCFMVGVYGQTKFAEKSNCPQKVFTEADIRPEFAGEKDGLESYIKRQQQYPQEAINKNIEGTVYVQFVVDSIGNVCCPKVIQGIGGGCDEEALRIINEMGKWAPASNAGSRVNFLYTIPFTFNLYETVTLETGKQLQVLLYGGENLPEYPGGQMALYNFISNNIIYPDSAKTNNIEGKVYIRFIIDTQGRAVGFTSRSPHPILSREAIRVLQNMPLWKPGTKDGKPVNVYMNYPIDFKLN